MCLSLLFLTEAKAWDSWEIDKLQGILGDPTIFGGSRNIHGKSAMAPYTIGIGSEERGIDCTATPISRRVLLTAGHCLLPPPTVGGVPKLRPENLRIFFVKTYAGPASNIKGEVKIARAEALVVHPRWESFVKEGLYKISLTSEDAKERAQELYRKSRPSLTFDLGLILLEEELPKDFAIAALPRNQERQNLKPDCQYWISGYGIDKNMNLEEREGIRPSKSAKIDPKEILWVGHGFSISGHPTFCSGDSGGPLLEICGQRPTVIGVASSFDISKGPPTCEEPGVVAVHAYAAAGLDWILEQLQKFKNSINL